jgi:protein TonB
MNTQQSLRRTLKPRSGGAPNLPLLIVGVVAVVLLIGGGIGYAVETGHKHDSAPPQAVGLAAIVPPLESFASVTPITYPATTKKHGKHSAAPASQASPGVTPSPGASPTSTPAVSLVSGKTLAPKHPAHHVKLSALPQVAFDPSAATQAASNAFPTPSSAQITATAAPTVAPTPQATPVYEPAVVVDARFVSQVQPIYPEIAKGQGIQGTVVVLVTVGPDGNAISLTVGQSAGNRQLDNAALDAARASKFQAPEVDGHPATQTYRIVYNFAL